MDDILVAIAVLALILLAALANVLLPQGGEPCKRECPSDGGSAAREPVG
jgi:hypothetical protein